MIPLLIIIWEWLKRKPKPRDHVADGLRDVFLSRIHREAEVDAAFARAIAPDKTKQ